MIKRTLTLFFLTVSLIFGCNRNSKKETVDKEQLTTLLTHNSIKIIDVRTSKEYEEAHIPEAINYPIESLMDSLPLLDQSEEIIVVCRSGNRSRKAKRLLIDNGFNKVYDGGSWKNVEKVLNELQK